jgi:hypothetical protein
MGRWSRRGCTVDGSSELDGGWRPEMDELVAGGSWWYHQNIFLKLYTSILHLYIYIYQHLRETQHNTKIFHQVKSVLKSLLTNHSNEECSNQTYRSNYLFPS